MKSKYSISRNINEFTDDFLAMKGFDLIDAKYANGVWFGAFGDGIGKKSPTKGLLTAWYSEPTFKGLRTRISEAEEDGYKLTDIDVTPGGYSLGIFSNKQSNSALIIARTYSDFNNQVDALQEQETSLSLAYQVVDIEYADGLLIGVLDRNGSDADYQYRKSYREFTEVIESKREEGLELTNVEYVGGGDINAGWYGVFSDELTGLSIYSPEPHDSIRDFQAEIREFSSQGFDLINIESIEGDWFGIYKEDIYNSDIITPSDKNATDSSVAANTTATITTPNFANTSFDP